MKKDIFNNIKKDKKFLLKILAIINVILAIFALAERIIFMSHLISNVDMGLDSDFIIPTIINMDMLSFNSITLLLISIFTILGLFKNNKNMLISEIILTGVLSLTSVVYSFISLLNNPFETVESFILLILLLVAWNLLAVFSYKKQKSILEKIV